MDKVILLDCHKCGKTEEFVYIGNLHDKKIFNSVCGDWFYLEDLIKVGKKKLDNIEFEIYKRR